MKTMIRFTLALMLLSFVVVSLSNAAPNWTVTALNTSTYTAIPFPSGASCGYVTGYVSDGTAVTIATDIVGTNARPLPANTPEAWGSVCPKYGTNVVYYVKASAGTPDFILLYTSN